MEVLIVAGALVAIALYESENKENSDPNKGTSSDDSFKPLVPPSGTGSTDTGTGSSTQPVDPNPPPPSPGSSGDPSQPPPPPPFKVEQPKPYTYCLVSDGQGNWTWNQSLGATNCVSPNRYDPAFVGVWVGGKYSGHYNGNFVDPMGQCTPQKCDQNKFPNPFK